MAMLKLCSCGKPIDITLARCNNCKLQKQERHQLYDTYRRDKKAKAFYNSKEWELLREQALLRDVGICVHCMKNGKITLADMVDHILPIKFYWEYRLTLDNLQSLCNPCHAVKTAEDKRKYKNKQLCI